MKKTTKLSTGENFLINKLSAFSAIIVFIIVLLFKLYCNAEIKLADIVTAVIAGGMLPLAIAFVIYPFYSKYLPSIKSMSLQFTITGLVLMFVYLKTIYMTIIT